MYATPLQMALAAIPPLTAEEQQALLCDRSLTELQAVFARLPDPRQRLERRFPLPLLLTCLVAALLCNCNPSFVILGTRSTVRLPGGLRTSPCAYRVWNTGRMT